MLRFFHNLIIFVVVGVSGACCFAQEPASPTLLDFPHAGISLSVPAEFESQLLEHPKELAKFVKFSQKDPVGALIVSAYLAGPDDTLDTVSQAMQEIMAQSLAVREIKILKTTAISIAGHTGQATLMSYKFRGKKTVSAQTYFIRDLKNLGLRICYIITVETPEKDNQKLLPLLGEVINTVKLLAVQAPSAIPLGLSENKVMNIKKGIAVTVPKFWHAFESEMGITLGVTDYLYGAATVPNVDIISINLPGKVTSRDCAQKAIAAFTKEAKQQNKKIKLVSEQQTSVGDNPASVFVMLITPEKQPATSQNQDAGIIRAVTSLCLCDEKKNITKSYAIILTARPQDSEFAAKWMKAIAAGLEILKPAK